MLSDREGADWIGKSLLRLNAPYGARCFLTGAIDTIIQELESLNAPYGARCFLTILWKELCLIVLQVLMHLMVRGAF